MDRPMTVYVRALTTRRPLAFIVLFALIANVMLAVVVPKVEVWNDTEVAHIAASIANGQGFSSPYAHPSGPSAWIPPVYPYLLATILRVFGGFTATSYWIAIGMNIVVHALTCVLLFWCAKDVFGPRVGWYSACALAGLPLFAYPLVLLHLVSFGGQGLLGLFISPKIIWYTHLSELAIVLLIWFTLHPPHWVIYGTTWAAVSLLNPTILALAPAFVAWRFRRRESWRYLGLTIAVAALCVTPWLVRNYFVFHRPVFIRDNFGVELRVGNQPGNRGLLSRDVHPMSNEYELSRLIELGEPEYSRVAGQEALDSIRTHRGEFVRNTILRVGYFWLGTPMRSRLGSLAFVKYLPALTVSLLAFYGAVRSLRRSSESAFLFVAVLLFYPIVYYITHTNSGYFYQYPIQPQMLALAISVLVRQRTPQRSQGDHEACGNESLPA
ncbi:MAG TPA: hypothetical protein VI431_12550 [Candidatus Acidoferrum sp.]